MKDMRIQGCEDCNEMRNGALLRCWGAFLSLAGSPSPTHAFAAVRVSLHTTECLRSCDSPAKVISLLCSLARAFRNKVSPILQLLRVLFEIR